MPTSFDISSAGYISELATSSTLQFNVTNAQPTDADKRVTSRVVGGNSNGTIDANGLYAAPRAVPTPAQITIKATSTLDNTITTTHSLTITASN